MLHSFGSSDILAAFAFARFIGHRTRKSEESQTRALNQDEEARR
jgi:hypothetical protein